MDITIETIRLAECNIEGIKCPKCGDTRETLYHQYGDFCTCQSCGHDWD